MLMELWQAKQSEGMNIGMVWWSGHLQTRECDNKEHT